MSTSPGQSGVTGRMEWRAAGQSLWRVAACLMLKPSGRALRREGGFDLVESQNQLGPWIMD